MVPTCSPIFNVYNRILYEFYQDTPSITIERNTYLWFQIHITSNGFQFVCHQIIKQSSFKLKHIEIGFCNIHLILPGYNHSTVNIMKGIDNKVNSNVWSPLIPLIKMSPPLTPNLYTSLHQFQYPFNYLKKTEDRMGGAKKRLTWNKILIDYQSNSIIELIF